MTAACGEVTKVEGSDGGRVGAAEPIFQWKLEQGRKTEMGFLSCQDVAAGSARSQKKKHSVLFS